MSHKYSEVASNLIIQKDIYETFSNLENLCYDYINTMPFTNTVFSSDDASLYYRKLVLQAKVLYKNDNKLYCCNG